MSQRKDSLVSGSEPIEQRIRDLPTRPAPPEGIGVDDGFGAKCPRARPPPREPLKNR